MTWPGWSPLQGGGSQAEEMGSLSHDFQGGQEEGTE